jgi:hypothetical protein
MRRLILLAVLLILIFSMPVHCQTIFGEVPDPTTKKNHFFMSIGYDTAVPMQVVDIPYWARTVETHRDDANIGYQRMRRIPYKDARTAYDNRFFLAMGGDHWFGNYFLLRYGGFASFFTDIDKKKPGNENIREWGQFVDNNHRGAGTSLVFYRIVPSALVPGMFVELNAKLFSGTPAFIVGYGGSYGGLNIQTGWDRFDKLEVGNTSSLDGDPGKRVWSHRPYFGLAIPFTDDGLRGSSIRFTLGQTFRPQIQFGSASLINTSFTSFRMEITTFVSGR